MSLLDRIPIPIGGMEAFEKSRESKQNIINKILEGHQNQERINQQALSNDQLNKYRTNSLELQKQSHPLEMDLLREKIKSMKELSEWRKRGGSGNKGGASTGDELKFHQVVSDYNPHLDENQLREAVDAYSMGKNTLNDGTKLAPITPTIKRALDRAFKGTTTSSLLNQGVSANAAEAEMNVVDKYINNGREPYGNTIMGYSPQQIKDSLNPKDEKSQNRLGDYIASEMLSLDKAALQLRILGGEKGVTLLNEAMDKAKQSIKAKYPILSDNARKRALSTISKALKEMLSARNEYGIGASNAIGNNKIKFGYTPEKDIESVEPEYRQNENESGMKIEKTKEIDGRKYVFFDNNWHSVKR